MSLPVNLGVLNSAEVFIKPNDLVIVLKGLLKMFETFFASVYMSVSL